MEGATAHNGNGEGHGTAGEGPTLRDVVLGMASVLGRLEREVENLVDERGKDREAMEKLTAAVRENTAAVKKVFSSMLAEYQKNLASADPTKAPAGG